MKAISAARGAAIARVTIGVALTVATQPLLRAMVQEGEPTAAFVLFARTVGIRDTMFGLGCLLSTRRTRDGEIRRWVQLWLANELADVVAALSAARRLGATNASIAAIAPLPLIAVDVWTLHSLAAADRAPTNNRP